MQTVVWVVTADFGDEYDYPSCEEVVGVATTFDRAKQLAEGMHLSRHEIAVQEVLAARRQWPEKAARAIAELKPPVYRSLEYEKTVAYYQARTDEQEYPMPEFRPLKWSGGKAEATAVVPEDEERDGDFYRVIRTLVDAPRIKVESVQTDSVGVGL